MVSAAQSHRVLSTYKASYKNLPAAKEDSNRQDSPGPLNAAKLADLHAQYSAKNTLINDYMLASLKTPNKNKYLDLDKHTSA